MSSINVPVALEWSVATAALVGGAAFALAGAGYGLTNVTGVGAGFFPTIAGVLTGVAGLLWLLQLLAVRRSSALLQGPEPISTAPDNESGDGDVIEESATESLLVDGIDEEESDVDFPNRAGWLRVAIIVASIFAAAMLLPILGFTLAMVLLLFTVLLFVSRRPWWLAGVVAIAASIASRLVFEVWLGTSLPHSSVGLLRMLGL